MPRAPAQGRTPAFSFPGESLRRPVGHTSREPELSLP